MSTPQQPSAPSSDDRRRHPRYDFGISVELEWGSSILEGQVRDISAGGMRIEMADPLWIGARFLAVIALEPPLRVECVVRRVEPGKAMGVTLATQTAEERARLVALIENLGKK